MSTHTRLKEQLDQLITENPYSLEAAVAKEALEYCGEEIEVFFSDLLQHGCQGGMVDSLIYYMDTHAFYDKYYAEIETLRCELEEDFGQPLQIKGDLKNWFAWLAFEETARKLADLFELR